MGALRYFSRAGQVFDRYVNLLTVSERVYHLAREIQDMLDEKIQRDESPV